MRPGQGCIENIVDRPGPFTQFGLLQRGLPRKTAEEITRNRTSRTQSGGDETSERKQNARH